jgi:murein L,D-transpeptidase YafK
MKKIIGLSTLSFFGFSSLILLFSNYIIDPNPSIMYADKVVVHKTKRILYLYNNNKVIFSCKISLGTNPVGNKEMEGDRRTPVGTYKLDWRNPHSKYHKSIHISYPNQKDKERAALKNVSPGGLIMIHGIRDGIGWIGKLHLLKDWTHGCIAVTNKEMDIIWKKVKDGTPIEILE